MKNIGKASLLTFTSVLFLGVTGCINNGGGSKPTAKFDYQLSLESGSKGVLYVSSDGEYNDRIVISESNKEKGKEYSYLVTTYAPGVVFNDYLEYNLSGTYIELTPKKVTEENLYLTISVAEASAPRKTKSLSFTINSDYKVASAGYNFAAANTEEAKAERTKILGKLEEYAMDNYLAGITLFENGGYTRYSSRVTIPAKKYITGYGWGVLTEGKLTGTLPGTASGNHPDYYQSASSSDPLSINAWDATGSQVSDLNSYISTSYWGTRMTSDGLDYEWYPVLANDNYSRPITTEEPNDLGMYTKWRIYVKTSEIKYRTAATSKFSKYNNRSVALEDYETTIQMLLSENSKVVRGSELAGDSTYGIRGGQDFYRRSKGMKDEDFVAGKSKLDRLWDSMKENGELGVDTGIDPNNGLPYIDFELVTPVDDFTAMYTLSSNLYTPMPKEFLREIGGGDYTKGAVLYGTFPDTDTDIRDMTLCVGPYYLESWEQNSYIAFKRNDDWFEYTPGGKRYQINGVFIRTITSIAEDDNNLWLHFMQTQDVDSTNIPKDHMAEVGDHALGSQDKKSEGDATFKLNVNSCDKDRWNYLFGKNGVISQGEDNAWDIKPWMSNKDFLKGLFWSINRPQFAEKRGVNPSVSYFSSAYLSDPEKGKSYNDTPEHEYAIRNFHDVSEVQGETVDNYGYNVATAGAAFRKAVNTLSQEGKLTIGTASNPTTIRISIWWMYATDIKGYGDDISGYFTKTFNEAVTGVKLVVDQEAVTQWDKVYYDHLMVGKFDLGFGAISGNTYNPLNFMEVLKSDNSSGFTLNWGPDTGKVDEVNPIVYKDPATGEDKAWSYDALWAAADHGTIVKDGQDSSPVENFYLANVSNNKLYEGGTFDVPFTWVALDDPESVSLKVTEIKLFSLYSSVVIEKKDPNKSQSMYYEETENGYRIYISEAAGAAFNQKLIDEWDLQKEADKKTDPDEKLDILTPFRYDRYGIRWDLEINYEMRINGGYPSRLTAVAYINKSAQDDAKKR